MCRRECSSLYPTNVIKFYLDAVSSQKIPTQRFVTCSWGSSQRAVGRVYDANSFPDLLTEAAGFLESYPFGTQTGRSRFPPVKPCGELHILKLPPDHRCQTRLERLGFVKIVPILTRPSSQSQKRSLDAAEGSVRLLND